MSLFAPRPPRLLLGSAGWWGLDKLWLAGPDIAKHKHVIGLTGQGKSKLLASLFVQLVEQNIACSLIDPHADLAEEALALAADRGLLPAVRFVDFTRSDAYLPFNVLRQPAARDDQHVARTIVDAFQRAWPQLARGAAPHFENLLLASSLVLIQNGKPITELPRLLVNRFFRDMLLRRVSDPQVIDYFRYRFDRYGRETADKVESTLNKVFNLTFSLTLRYTLGQPENALNLRQIIDEGASVIYNLGGLDEDTQAFLGSLLMLGYEQAALSRGDSIGSSRRPHHLLVDEFVRFADKSQKAFTTMLSQTRKYGLFVTMAHQNFGPEDEPLRRALGNALRIAFRVNREDAIWLAPQLAAYDPETVKHEVEDDAAKTRTHPLFTTVVETYEAMAVELERGLRPREAYASIGGAAIRFRTATVPMSATTPMALKRIKDRFARQLLQPAHVVVPHIDRRGAEPYPPRLV